MNKELLKMQLANTCDGINRATRERAALVYKLNTNISLSPTGEVIMPAGLCEDINAKLEEIDERLKKMTAGLYYLRQILDDMEGKE